MVSLKTPGGNETEEGESRLHFLPQPVAQTMVNMRKIAFARNQPSKAEPGSGKWRPGCCITFPEKTTGKEIMVYGDANFVNSLITPEGWKAIEQIQKSWWGVA